MTMMLDIGTTIAIWALALALIPLPDVLIGWFCMFFPQFRSPSTRMGDLHDSMESTRELLCRNKPDWNDELEGAADPGPLPDLARDVELEVDLGPVPKQTSKTRWKILRQNTNDLEILVKGGGWARYSVKHLRFWRSDVKRLNKEFADVTKELETLNQDVFTPLVPIRHDHRSKPKQNGVPASQEGPESSPLLGSTTLDGLPAATTGTSWSMDFKNALSTLFQFFCRTASASRAPSETHRNPLAAPYPTDSGTPAALRYSLSSPSLRGKLATPPADVELGSRHLDSNGRSGASETPVFDFRPVLGRSENHRDSVASFNTDVMHSIPPEGL
ncbi:uncharacterized protein TRAVEDRAFT_24671 [Trametes versicolor FP-101664 SS1]|uniref:Uncharacterized protein n=1 Tax=Trametes versicolor (strain FP-101664) TaxID=717944 RepID=R7S7B2_TRAVS|nr:uncharacterized protein TRAVEDRAFT_24671 [Trametes versicolor FP-101664 SS1]EIW51918.1 hypothetical protein TRAVEDRAFT_24671 [Trametes versicolor FP-101664 SS1]